MLKQCLSGTNMANYVIQKANVRLKFFLYRKGKFLNLTTKKLLVMCLIQSHFDYACSFWYPGLSKVLKNKLQVDQNKIIWFVLNMDSRALSGSSVFMSLGWLPVSIRVDQIILNHVLRLSRVNLQIIWSSSLFQQVPYTHMELDTMYRETGCFSIPKLLKRNPLDIMVVLYGKSSLAI